MPNYVYCPDCGEEHNSYARAVHKCNPETLKTLAQYEADDQAVRESYSLKAWYESKNTVNDHISFNVVSDADRVPVDHFDIYREGDRYLVRGQWKNYEAAQEWAMQVLGKWFN
jgi:hypothetical protein